jgi:hypothetical protein
MLCDPTQNSDRPPRLISRNSQTCGGPRELKGDGEIPVVTREEFLAACVELTLREYYSPGWSEQS